MPPESDIDRGVDPFAKCDLIKFLENRFLESFADAVGLRTLGFGLGGIDVFQGQVQLVLRLLFVPAVLGATVRQNFQQRYCVFFNEWTDAIVEDVSSKK